MNYEVYYSHYRGYGLILAHVAPGRVRLIGPFYPYEDDIERAMENLAYGRFERVA